MKKEEKSKVIDKYLDSEGNFILDKGLDEDIYKKQPKKDDRSNKDKSR
jgi:hypothetical protein